MAKPNPTMCCGVPQACCGEKPLPETLHASIVGQYECVCADTVIPLQLQPNTEPWSVSKIWQGTGSLDGCGNDRLLTLQVLCVENGGCAFKLFVRYDCYPFSPPFEDYGSPVECECGATTPLRSVWNGIFVYNCCTGGMGEIISVILTE